ALPFQTPCDQELVIGAGRVLCGRPRRGPCHDQNGQNQRAVHVSTDISAIGTIRGNLCGEAGWGERAEPEAVRFGAIVRCFKEIAPCPSTPNCCRSWLARAVRHRSPW